MTGSIRTTTQNKWSAPARSDCHSEPLACSDGGSCAGGAGADGSRKKERLQQVRVLAGLCLHCTFLGQIMPVRMSMGRSEQAVICITQGVGVQSGLLRPTETTSTQHLLEQILYHRNLTKLPLQTLNIYLVHDLRIKAPMIVKTRRAVI